MESDQEVERKKLSKESWLDVGFGEVILLIEFGAGKILMRKYVGGLSEIEDQCTQVKHLEEEYRSRMKQAARTTLFFNAPLWDETYEYNKEDGEWYLIKQGSGFA